MFLDDVEGYVLNYGGDVSVRRIPIRHEILDYVIRRSSPFFATEEAFLLCSVLKKELIVPIRISHGQNVVR